ncbi:MAG TPA: peptidase [Bacteroidales bacterium]|nr:peptidase [Bacteroidales bacterium]
MRFITVLFMAMLTVMVTAQSSFDKYFTDKVLRFDYMLAGDYRNTVVYPDGMKEEPFYGGSKTRLIDPFNYGNFKYELYDSAEDKLIYSRGFCTLYQEWQTTAEAKVMQRSFPEVATMPFPRNRCRFVLSQRLHDGSFARLYETEIDPSDYFIRKEKTVDARVSRILYAGDPALNVDLAFIAEGYRADEMNKFRGDVKRITDVLLDEPPYNEYKDRFNIWAVEAVSAESGTDIPGDGIYVSTVMNSSFYTFDLDRYLTTRDIKTVNDYAAVVPHDNIIILINSPKYGGGGVYNYYSCTTADHPLSAHVFVHELGHGFAGLADEYYSSTVAYENFYPLDVEPWEPNITTLVNFDSKWKKMISAKTPVPTPAEPVYNGIVGLFEGGGYSAKGIYRPQMECTMKSNTPSGLCKVCRKAVREMIEFYIK